jgi:phosphinothricin acetyltransferase
MISMNVTIEPLGKKHWGAIRLIYQQGIDTGNATFETSVPTWENWDSSHIKVSRYVAVNGDQVVGWAALSPVSERCAYQGVAEVSIYVAELARGQGVGRHLLAALIDSSEQAGIWTLQAGMFPENKASVALFRSSGFRRVGIRERLGRLSGVWRDVLLMERRSTVAGVEDSSS